jgi:hypothetical protein
MAENLRRMNDPAKIEQYDSLLKAEAGTLKAIERSTLEVNEQPGTVLGSPTE